MGNRRPEKHYLLIIFSPNNCHYKHVSDSRQVGEAAFRNMEPVGTVWGQLSYEMLQPGSC